MSKPKPKKPRVVYLIQNQDNPQRFLHHVGHGKQEATAFRDKYFPQAKIVKAEVKAK